MTQNMLSSAVKSMPKKNSLLFEKNSEKIISKVIPPIKVQSDVIKNLTMLAAGVQLMGVCLLNQQHLKRTLTPPCLNTEGQQLYMCKHIKSNIKSDRKSPDINNRLYVNNRHGTKSVTARFRKGFFCESSSFISHRLKAKAHRISKIYRNTRVHGDKAFMVIKHCLC